MVTKFDGELIKLENRKKELLNRLQDLTKKMKGLKKPDEVREAEYRKSSLVASRRNLLVEIRDLNKTSEDIRSQITGWDDQRPDKFKKSKVLPQDEQELDYLITGWDEY